MKTRNIVVLVALPFAALVCAAMVAVWFYVGRKYTAVAYLRVAMVETPVFGSTEPHETDPIRFEIYKNTQQQLVLSRFVLLAALRKPDVAKQLLIQAQEDVNRRWRMYEYLAAMPYSVKSDQ